MAVLAFLLPGPGAAHVGMGRGLYNSVLPVRNALDQADKLLQQDGVKPTRACIMGPEEDLLRPSVAGPALLALGRGLREILRQKRVAPQMVLGAGMGEVAALEAAGVVGFEDALRFLRLRGGILEAAFAKAPFHAATLTGMPVAEVEEKFAALRHRPLTVAVHDPECCTLAGDEALLRRLLPLVADGRKVRATEPAPGMAWPHPAFEAAAREVAAEFAKLPLERSGAVEVVSCAAGGWVPEVEAHAALQGALCHQPLRLDAGLKALFARGANTTVALGPGPMAAHARKVDSGVRSLACDDVKTLAQAVKLAN